jgi:hypothetical protein
VKRALAALFMGVTAFCIQRGATLAWGRALAPNGTRYKVSPIGLARVLTPARPVSLEVGCRWWPRGAGDASLCAVAPNGTSAFRRLRAAYPTLMVALWLSVIALFLQVLRVPRPLLARVAVTLAVAVLTATAVVLVTSSAEHALVVLDRLDVRYGSWGFSLVLSAFVSSALSGILLLSRRPG